MTHDVPFEGDTVGIDETRPVEGDQPAPVDHDLTDRPELRKVLRSVMGSVPGAPRLSRASPMWENTRVATFGPGQSRIDELAKEFGWGRSGRLLNSGWAWVPTQKRFVGQLDEFDQAVVR